MKAEFTGKIINVVQHLDHQTDVTIEIYSGAKLMGTEQIRVNVADPEASKVALSQALLNFKPPQAVKEEKE